MTSEARTSTSVDAIASDGCTNSEPRAGAAIDNIEPTPVAPVPSDGAPAPEHVPTEGENTIEQPDRLDRPKQE